MPDLKRLGSKIGHKIADDTIEVVSDIKDDFDDVINHDGIKDNNKKKTIIMVVIAVFLFVLCVVLLALAYAKQKDAAISAYNDVKVSASDTAYENMRQKLLELGEKRYHTSNDIGISIEGITRVSSLEALEITEIDYFIYSGEEEFNSEAWYKVKGTGTFTVNMELAEIITDEERQYILIRVPEPAIQPNDFNIVDIKQFHFESKMFEGVDSGIGIAEKAEKECYKNIKSKVINNQNYLKYAKNAASDLLVGLAESCNQEINLTVDVEFF